MLELNSHHLYSIKKGIVQYLKHWTKLICGNPDTYQQGVISIRNTLQSNNYPASIISASIGRNKKHQGQLSKFCHIVIHKGYIWIDSEVLQFRQHQDSIQKQFSSSEIFHPMHLWQGIQGRDQPLPPKQEQKQTKRESHWNQAWLIMYERKGCCQPLWNEIENNNGRYDDKVSAHTFGSDNLLSRPSKEMNTIWELLKNSIIWVQTLH